jgi:Zn-dependent peptidase ImmA (M78 family)
LADRISAAPTTIWNAEQGRPPTQSVLTALGLVLGFEVGFFSEKLTDEFTVEDCSFRSQAAVAERTRKKMLARGTLLAQLVRFLQTVVTFPQYNIRQFPVTSDDDVERAANACREHLGLGLGIPIAHMGRVLENNGVVVTKLDKESNQLDAFSAPPTGGGLGFVVLSDAKGSSSRSRFDMAHELGHLVMHAERKGTIGDREREANRFASAFLLPQSGFAREVWNGGKVNWDTIFALKTRWKVSVQAMVYRAHELKLIDELEFRRAYKKIHARGWKKNEPHEPNPESPELLSKALRMLSERKNIGPTEIAHKLHWTAQTFEDVLQTGDLPPGSEMGNSGLRLIQGARRAAAGGGR